MTRKQKTKILTFFSLHFFVRQLTNAANNFIGPFTDPGNVGNNGFWPVSETTTWFSGAQHIKKIEVCLPGSGAVTSLEYRECGSSGGGSGDPHIRKRVMVVIICF